MVKVVLPPLLRTTGPGTVMLTVVVVGGSVSMYPGISKYNRDLTPQFFTSVGVVTMAALKGGSVSPGTAGTLSWMLLATDATFLK